MAANLAPTNLAPIYLDDTRIRLQGDQHPRVSKILEAGGKGRSAKYQVMHLEFQSATEGKVLEPEDTIDRTTHSEVAVYLKVIRRNPSSTESPTSKDRGGSSRVDEVETGQPQVSPDASGPPAGASDDDTQPFTGMGPQQQSGLPRTAHAEEQEWKPQGAGHNRGERPKRSRPQREDSESAAVSEPQGELAQE